MEQAQQNTAQELTAQAIPQQAVEDACFHSLGLIGRNCEYLEQHLARVGADAQSLQAVSDISAATAKLERTINELLSALEFLRAGQPPKLYPLDLCELLQQVAAQADMVRAQLGVTLELDYGGWTTCRVLADRDDVELLCLHLLSNALRACREGGTVLTVTENGKGRRSDIDTYRITARGGKGIRNYDVSRDKVAAVKIVDDVDDVLLSSQEGIIIRLHANEIPLQSRYGSGVRVMRLGENDKVMVLARTDHDDEAQTEKIDASEAEAEPTAEQLAEMEAADAAAATEAPEADPEEKE